MIVQAADYFRDKAILQERCKHVGEWLFQKNLPQPSDASSADVTPPKPRHEVRTTLSHHTASPNLSDDAL